MSSKLFLSLSGGLKWVPQMDFSVTTTENAGVEATQSFLAKKSSLGTADLNPFIRGTKAEVLDPNVPPLYRNLTVKTFPHEDFAPGIIKISVTFTGYLYAAGESSGVETTIPTYSLGGTLEEGPLNESQPWKDLENTAKNRLSWLLGGICLFDIEAEAYGNVSEESGEFTAFPTGVGSPPVWVTPTGNELIFAKMISQGKTTYKQPSWTYTVREESERGFTSAQLAKLGKIVASPPGSPANPGSGWTWLLVGPSQEQSGEKRYFKDLNFLLIEDNDENQMLYGS